MTDAIETVEHISQQMAVNMLAPYLEARSERDHYAKTVERFGALLKDYLEREGGVVYDGERGIEASLQTRNGTPVYDLVAIREHDPVLFQRLIDLGCLAVNAAAVKAQGQQLVGIERYAGPGKGSVALIVSEKR